MLKRVFVAPDPGRLRLRSAARGVLGVALAVTVSDLATHSLPAAILGGLAALLALFTVADSSVRGQAVTTVLLPVAGFPVLALAAVLHDFPWVRDVAFVAVLGAGMHARRWGPRGHSLGTFAFMMFSRRSSCMRCRASCRSFMGRWLLPWWRRRQCALVCGATRGGCRRLLLRWWRRAVRGLPG